jgi:signal peptidase I
MTNITDTVTKPIKRKETPGEMVRSLIFMVLLALVFRSVAYEPFHIPSGSMLSTLYEGDYIFVSKLSYGYSRFSFPFAPKLFEGRIFATKPERGDVVVFRNPANPKVDYIKRLIGLPGDTIQVRHSRLYINGKMVEQTRRGEASVPDEEHGGWRSVPRYDETLPGGRTHIVLNDMDGNLDPRTNFDADNTGIYTVPEGHYFMMGDNRDHSQDSRFSPELGYDGAPGYVPFENFVGRAEVIAFSLKGLGGRWFKAIQ